MKKLILFLFAAVLLSGCAFLSRSGEVYAPQERYADSIEFEENLTEAASFEESRMKSSVIIDEGGFVEGVEQKIIRTGELSLHVSDVRKSVETIRSKAAEWQGDLSNSEVYRAENSYTAYLTLRVPSESFGQAMSGLKELAIYVESESSNAENVTSTYMDLEARLNNLRAEEQQYLNILGQASTVEEILKVTDYLNTVRYEIESTEGQVKYYDSQIDQSTIHLTLTEDESLSIVKEMWDPSGTVQEALSDWVAFLQNLVDRLIYLLIFVWPLVVVGLGVWLWRRSKKRKGH